MSSILKSGLAFVTLAALAGCAPDYSPDSYNANAVQQANKVEQAVVVGFRQVSISAAGTVGAVTGGAAGGILGAQVGPNGTTSALGAVGGGIVGSLLGTGIEHATSDTTGWEYIVQKPNGDLLSVTQREPQPIPLGQRVLVISGNQARIIPDYSVAKDPPKDAAKDKPKEPAKPVVLPPAATSIEPLPPPTNISAPPHSTWDSHAPMAVPENPAPAPEPATPPPPAEPAPAAPATAAPTPLAPATAEPPAPAPAPPAPATAPADESTLPEELRQ